MLKYIGIICALTGFLPIMSVCAGGGIVITCPHAKTNVLACEQTLRDRVNTLLAPFGKSFNTIDLGNISEGELLDEKTRDIVCSQANTATVSCIIGNVTACPDLAWDADVMSTWIASLIASNLTIMNSPQRVCELFQDSTCSYREIKMNTCYNAIVGEVLTENSNVNMCVSNKSDYLTCMLEVYKECKPYLNLTENQNIAANIKVRMVVDQWETFNTGSELCECYEGNECYSELNQNIANVTMTVVSVKDKYQNILATAESLCSNITRVKCTKKGQPKTCKNVLQNYNESVTRISVYNTAVDSICHTVNTNEFKTNKDCIIDKLTDSFHPCLEKAKLPTTINNCRDFRKLYSCVRDALKGQCDGDYISTAYEMIRARRNSILACDVTSSASLFTAQTFTTLLLIFVLCYVYFE